jgi:hypothetical protein
LVSFQAGLIQNSASRKKIHGSVTVLDPETPWHIMAFLMAYKQRAAKGFNPTANSGIEKMLTFGQKRHHPPKACSGHASSSLIYGQHKND